MSTLITKPHLLTQEGLDRLQEELYFLEHTRREELADRLHRALEDGQDDDFVDNAALEAARNDQSFVEGRILELKDILSNYELIEDDGQPSDIVRIGHTVTVVEEGFDEEEEYVLVGAAEADPAAGRISNESPLGRVLLGAKVGESVRVNAPNGVLNFRIAKID
jgi:transcription elongation factor GreA